MDWRSSLIGIAETAAARAGLQADWPAVVDDWRRADPPALAGLLEADGLTRLAEALGC